MDHPKADFETTLEQAVNRFGNKVIPIQYPYNSGEKFNSIIDVRQVFHGDPGKGEHDENDPTKGQDHFTAEFH